MDKVSERAILERARQPCSCDRVKGRDTEQRGGVGRRLRYLAGGWSDCRCRFPEAASGAGASMSALINAPVLRTFNWSGHSSSAGCNGLDGEGGKSTINRWKESRSCAWAGFIIRT